MRNARQSAIRTSAFLRKELVEVLRQPRLVAALVFGPFVILLLFGTGLKDRDPILATIFVTPGDDALTAEVERFATEPSWRLQAQAITDDEQAALALLERGAVDLVVVFPDDAMQTVRDNRRATVAIHHTLIDPIERRALRLALGAAIDRLNQQILGSLVAEGQVRAGAAEARLGSAQARVPVLQSAMEADDEATAQQEIERLRADIAVLSLQLAAAGVLDHAELAGDAVGDEQRIDDVVEGLAAGLEALSHEDQAGRAAVDEIARDLDRLDLALAEFQTLSPETIVNPFRGGMRRHAPVDVGLTDFFAPGVVVLLVQHMLVTLVGLSVVRDEQLGTTELFRVSPLTAGELLVGKYGSYLLLSAGVSTLLMTLLVTVLGVPLAGSLAVLAASVAALVFTAIGMGFVIALLARTDSQAVQYAMLVLLASIFLTGFIVGLERVVPSLQAVAWALPPTYGIALLRDVMLRGTAVQLSTLFGLVGIGTGLLAVSWLLLRRRITPPSGRRAARRSTGGQEVAEAVVASRAADLAADEATAEMLLDRDDVEHAPARPSSGGATTTDTRARQPGRLGGRAGRLAGVGAAAAAALAGIAALLRWVVRSRTD